MNNKAIIAGLSLALFFSQTFAQTPLSGAATAQAQCAATNHAEQSSNSSSSNSLGNQINISNVVSIENKPANCLSSVANSELDKRCFYQTAAKEQKRRKVFFEVGLLKNLTENALGELSYSYSAQNHQALAWNSGGLESALSNSRANILMIGGRFKVFKTEDFYIFLSSRIGFAHFRQKISFGEQTSSKKYYNLAYSITGGVSSALAEQVSLEAAYVYIDAGKSRNYNFPSIHHQSHNISVGLVFNLLKLSFYY